MKWLDTLLLRLNLQIVREHREPDDVDPKHYLRTFTPKKVWVRCSDAEVIGPCEAKFFRSGKIIVQVFQHGAWMELYPDGSGSSYVKEWWPDDVVN